MVGATEGSHGDGIAAFQVTHAPLPLEESSALCGVGRGRGGAALQARAPGMQPGGLAETRAWNSPCKRGRPGRHTVEGGGSDVGSRGGRGAAIANRNSASGLALAPGLAVARAGRITAAQVLGHRMDAGMVTSGLGGQGLSGRQPSALPGVPGGLEPSGGAAVHTGLPLPLGLAPHVAMAGSISQGRNGCAACDWFKSIGIHGVLGSS